MRSTAARGTNSVMSIALVAFSSNALTSSAEKRTYWSLANSYPLEISSFSTSEPSLAQMYCCFRREPHLVWIMLKLIALEDSLEEKRLTGTETSPKEIVAEPIDRAAMRRLDIQAGFGPR